MALSMVFISFKVFIHFCWWNNEWYAGNSWLIWNKLNKVYEHHKDTKLFQDKFHNDKKVFKETLKNLRNSFLEQEPQLVHNISKKLLDQVIESVKCSKHIGNHQFKSFVTEHLIEGTSSLYNTIKKNSLACIIKKNIVPIKQKVVNLSYDCQFISNLCIASQAREVDFDEFFAHENHAFPVFTSEYGTLHAAKGNSEFVA